MNETPITAIDRSERAGSPGLVLLLAAVLVAAAAVTGADPTGGSGAEPPFLEHASASRPTPMHRRDIRRRMPRFLPRFARDAANARI